MGRSTVGLALVSGGAGAIGQAVCRRLQVDGWRLAVGYVSRGRAESFAGELSARGRPAVAVPLDLRDLSAVRRSVTRLLGQCGPVGAIVFAGGGAAAGTPFVRSEPLDWIEQIDVNFSGPLLVTRLCLPGMLAAGRGAIVGVTSEAAKVGDPGHAAYSAGKGAMAAFMAQLSVRYGRDGIYASSVAPGPIDTPLLEHALGQDRLAEKLDGLRRAVPVGRLGTPDEVAECVGYMLANAAAVAGEQLSIGGGLTMQ